MYDFPSKVTIDNTCSLGCPGCPGPGASPVGNGGTEGTRKRRMLPFPFPLPLLPSFPTVAERCLPRRFPFPRSRDLSSLSSEELSKRRRASPYGANGFLVRRDPTRRQPPPRSSTSPYTPPLSSGVGGAVASRSNARPPVSRQAGFALPLPCEGEGYAGTGFLLGVVRP